MLDILVHSGLFLLTFRVGPRRRRCRHRNREGDVEVLPGEVRVWRYGNNYRGEARIN